MNGDERLIHCGFVGYLTVRYGMGFVGVGEAKKKINVMHLNLLKIAFLQLLQVQ